MEDVLTDIPPPSRFYPEDLNNFAPLLPTLPSPFLVLSNPNPNHESPKILIPSLLIISLSSPSHYLLHNLSPKTLIGSLFLPEISLCNNSLEPSLSNKSCDIFSLDQSPSTVVVSVQFSVKPERAYAVAKCLFNWIQPEKVLIFDTIRSASFRGKLSLDNILAFKLETQQQRRDPEGSVLQNIDPFPSGSLIDGLAAALMSQCEIKRIKGTLCLSWPDFGISVLLFLMNLMKDILKDYEVNVDVLGFEKHKASRFDSELYT